MSVFNSARKHIESLYTGTCSVYELNNIRDEDTKQTRQIEQMIIENQPCRISFESTSPTTKNNDTVQEKVQNIKLFMSPDLTIPPGSKIVVNQNNREGIYKSSGVPAMYATHQEVALEIFERWG